MTKTDRLVVALIYRQKQGGLAGRAARAALLLLGVDFHASVGPGLTVLHSTSGGLVTHAAARIGSNVTIMHGVTIGRSDLGGPSDVGDGPRFVIEDDVFIGAGAVILARAGRTLTIGRGAVIGANAVVLESVPAGETWAGNPARCIARAASTPELADVTGTHVAA